MTMDGIDMLAELEKMTKPKESGPTQAQTLMRLAGAMELFHTADGTAYATVPVDGHKETWRLYSDGCKKWLRWQYWCSKDSKGKPIGSKPLKDAIDTLAALAGHDRPEYKVWIRTAEHEGSIFIDLGDPEWRAIEVTPRGWHIVLHAPVRFIRAAGMKALPEPQRGGTIEELRPLVNAGTEENFRLMIGWLLAAMRPAGPFPVLALSGEQGSAKSSVSRYLRSLVDPSTAGLRAAPEEIRDFMITARNSWLVAWDNISHIREWESDALCRLSTGGAFSTRALWTDDEEVLFDAQRPVVLNGISTLPTRGDLLDRAVLINLPSIPEKGAGKKREQSEIDQEFAAATPRIYGALLDAMSCGLRRLPETHLDRLPRMADFAMWVVACEKALPWPAGGFMEAYDENRGSVHELAIDATLVGPAIIQLLRERGEFHGTATELKSALEEIVGEETRRRKGWPQSPAWISKHLARLAPNLRALGCVVEKAFGARQRTIVLQGPDFVPAPTQEDIPGL